MTQTKRKIIEQAYSEIGYASYSFDLQPEQFESALVELNTMLAEWLLWGYDLSYNSATDELNDESGIADGYIPAVYSNLAIRIAPELGRVPLPGTMVKAKRGLALIRASLGAVPARVADRSAVPSGVGNYPFDGPLGMPEPEA